MSGLFCSLFREIHYIATLLIIKGAGICSLYHEIHYIEIRYIEVWVYFQNLFFEKNLWPGKFLIMSHHLRFGQ